MEKDNIAMKMLKKHVTQLPRTFWASALAALVLTLFQPLPAARAAANANPGIVPIQASAYGKSYGEWSVAWWQWALAIPEAQNPLVDNTGAFGGLNQSGPVWFLGGTLGNSVERHVTIPAGKAIFFPIHNWVFGAGVFDCDPTVPGVTCEVPVLREKAAAAAGAVQTLQAWIDGVPVKNLRDYRAVSPGTFSITFPEGAIFGIPVGNLSPHVSDGYWLMLSPLSVGQHSVQMQVVSPDYGIDYVVTVHITIQ